MITTVIIIFFGKLTCNCMSVFFLSLSVTLYHLTFLFSRLSINVPLPLSLRACKKQPTANLLAVNKKATELNNIHHPSHLLAPPCGIRTSLRESFTFHRRQRYVPLPGQLDVDPAASSHSLPNSRRVNHTRPRPRLYRPAAGLRLKILYIWQAERSGINKGITIS